MRGVLLAGGLGTRLRPLTTVVNKHLLPVHDKPMIFYPLQMMADAGITEVLIVVGGQSTESIMKLVKDGKEFGFKRVYYVLQDGEGGIAQALSLAEQFANDEPICVVLGDNVMLGGDLTPHVKTFNRGGYGAMVLCVTVSDPEHYGVPTIDKDSQRILFITEKPEHPTSKYGVIGVYFYDETVFDKIRTLTPSARGELEITDVNNLYAQDGDLDWDEPKGTWVDAGSSIEAWLEAGKLVKEFNQKEVVAR